MYLVLTRFLFFLITSFVLAMSSCLITFSYILMSSFECILLSKVLSYMSLSLIPLK